jgi:uncharacterized protein (TIGR04255 family)
MRDEYPEKPRQQNVVEAALQMPPNQPPNFFLRDGFAKVQLSAKGGSRLVAVGRDIVSIHMLRPYQDSDHPDKGGWDDFRCRINSALEAYWSVSKPLGVKRIGLRYINRIVVPSLNINFAEFFRCGPPEVKGFPDKMNSFLIRNEYSYEDGIRFLLTYASTDTPEKGTACILDLDVIYEVEGEPLPKEKVMVQVDEIRMRERELFESLITDKARELFDAD